MARELHNEDVWRQCGFESPPSRQTLSQFITDFELVSKDVFIELVHKLAEQVPLGKLFRIDRTDIPVDHRDEDADWNYDHTEDDYYYSYGCCVVTATYNIPVAAAFTPAKKVDEETAMHVTRSPSELHAGSSVIQSLICWRGTTGCWSSQPCRYRRIIHGIQTILQTSFVFS
jgi:hypothetical protein